MLIDTTQLENLSPDEYLALLVEVFFKFYHDKNIMLSLINIRKETIFSTQLVHQFFNYSETDKLHTTPDTDPAAKDYPHLVKFVNQAFNYVLNNRTYCHLIIFERHKYNDKFIAFKMRVDPVFKGQELVGLVTRSFDFTALYFGLARWPTNLDNKKLDINILQLGTLTPRQKQIVFLLLLGFGQEDIAHSLSITRGTIARAISNICIRLDLRLTSSNYLLSELRKLDKLSIFNVLYTGDIPFQPLAVMVENEFSIIY